MLERAENVSSLETVRSATNDALALLEKSHDQFQNQEEFSLIHNYLRNYAQALNDDNAFAIMTANRKNPADVYLADISDEQYLDIVDANEKAITRQIDIIGPRGPRGHRGHADTEDIVDIEATLAQLAQLALKVTATSS